MTVPTGSGRELGGVWLSRCYDSSLMRLRAAGWVAFSITCGQVIVQICFCQQVFSRVFEIPELCDICCLGRGAGYFSMTYVRLITFS